MTSPPLPLCFTQNSEIFLLLQNVRPDRLSPTSPTLNITWYLPNNIPGQFTPSDMQDRVKLLEM